MAAATEDVAVASLARGGGHSGIHSRGAAVSLEAVRSVWHLGTSSSLDGGFSRATAARRFRMLRLVTGIIGGCLTEIENITTIPHNGKAQRNGLGDVHQDATCTNVHTTIAFHFEL